MDAVRRSRALARAMFEVVGDLWKFAGSQGAVYFRRIAKIPTFPRAARNRQKTADLWT